MKCTAARRRPNSQASDSGYGVGREDADAARETTRAPRGVFVRDEHACVGDVEPGHRARVERPGLPRRDDDDVEGTNPFGLKCCPGSGDEPLCRERRLKGRIDEDATPRQLQQHALVTQQEQSVVFAASSGRSRERRRSDTGEPAEQSAARRRHSESSISAGPGSKGPIALTLSEVTRSCW